MDDDRVVESNAVVNVQLSRPAALVLDNLLARWWDTSQSPSSLSINHDAEWHALSVLAGALETQLVEPFMPDYLDRVEAARASLMERFGKLEK